MHFIQNFNAFVVVPEAEFSASLCRTLKFFCSSDDGVSRLLIIKNDTFYKSDIKKKKQDDVNIISI